MPLTFELLGTRGSTAMSGKHYAEFGGATSCYRLVHKQSSLIFDAGSGIVPLGQELLAQANETPCARMSLDIVFSHLHMDHFAGLLFFAPLYDTRFKITLWASAANASTSVERVLEAYLRNPFSPIRREHILAELRFQYIEKNAKVELSTGVRIDAMELPHPGGNTAYKASIQGKSVVYTGDFSQHDLERKKGASEALADFIDGADLALLDCTYTPAAYPDHKDYGHSHWLAAGQLAHKAKSWLGIHHHHLASDADLRAVESELRQIYPEGGLGRDGQIMTF